ncbi:hypothetical protein AB0D37_44310 [Streptomyces sp. NPDC048384]|uniref:hypothetical protein n=1 Tax=Streptomyces sp. NPDC048384 TaxID=3155487 RepID=UPI00342CF7F4
MAFSVKSVSHPASTSPSGPRARQGRLKQRSLALFTAAAVIGGGFVAFSPAASAAPSHFKTIFGPGSANKPFTVPSGVTEIEVAAIGARGASHTAPGGFGAAVFAGIRVTPGETLYVWVPAQNTGRAADVRTSPSAPLTGVPGIPGGQGVDPRLIVAAGGGEAGHPIGEWGDTATGGNAGSFKADSDGANENISGAGGGLHGTDNSGGKGGKSFHGSNLYPGGFSIDGNDGKPGYGGRGGFGQLWPGNHQYQPGGRGGDGWFGGGGGGGGIGGSGGSGAGGGAGSSYITNSDAVWTTIATNVSNLDPVVTISYSR